MAAAAGKRSPHGVMITLLGKMERGLAWASSGAILLIMLAVTTDVVGRYVFNSPVPGVYESVELLLVAVVFLSIAYIQHKGGHVRVNFLIKRLPGKWYRIMGAFALVASLWVMSLLTYRSAQLAYESLQMGATKPGLIDYPLWPSEIMVPVGAGVLCLRFLVQLLSRDYTFERK